MIAIQNVRHGPPALRRALAVAALAALLGSGCGGCSEDGTGNPPQDDASTDTSEQDAGTDTSDDTSEDTSQDVETDTGPQGPPPTQAFQGCAAGTTLRGDGVTAVHCFGPDNPSGFESRSGDIIWQPGASRVVLPTNQ